MASFDSRRGTPTFVVALLLWGVLLAAPAAAATITPTRADDPADAGAQCIDPPLDCSLRNAVAAAQPGGLVDLRQGPPGPYQLTQDAALQISSGMAVVGPGAGSRVIARTGGVGSVFDIGPGQGQQGASASSPDGVFISGLAITGGRGQRFGGGLTISYRRDVVLRGLAITGNRSDPAPGRAGGGAGAGVMSFESSVTIIDSSIIGNVSSSGPAEEYNSGNAVGGGVYNSGGPLRVVNSTIAANHAQRGGGLYQAVVHGDNTTSLSNVTLARNSAPGGGGNVFIFDGKLMAANSIVAGGSGPLGAENCDGDIPALRFVSRGHNVESPTTQCNFVAPDDLQGVSDPGLAEPADNGGGTGTLALLTGSPAIDAGPPEGCGDAAFGPIGLDQRGVLRPLGDRCDAGAFEAPADRAAPYPGCRVVAAPQATEDDVRAVVGCGATRRVVVTGTVDIGRPASAAARRARGAARAYALDRSTRVVRRGRRTTIRLRWTTGSRNRIREARAQRRPVRVLLAVRARPVARARHRSR